MVLDKESRDSISSARCGTHHAKIKWAWWVLCKAYDEVAHCKDGEAMLGEVARDKDGEAMLGEVAHCKDCEATLDKAAHGKDDEVVLGEEAHYLTSKAILIKINVGIEHSFSGSDIFEVVVA